MNRGAAGARHSTITVFTGALAVLTAHLLARPPRRIVTVFAIVRKRDAAAALPVVVALRVLDGLALAAFTKQLALRFHVELLVLPAVSVWVLFSILFPGLMREVSREHLPAFTNTIDSQPVNGQVIANFGQSHGVGVVLLLPGEEFGVRADRRDPALRRTD
jgi:hypothetical protein